MIPIYAAHGVIASSIGGSLLPDVTNLYAFVISNQLNTVAGAHSGVGDALSSITSERQTITDAAGVFTANDHGRRCVISGSTVANNNGNWYVDNFLTTTTINIVHYTGAAAGSAEASFTGTWSFSNKYAQIIDLKNGRAFGNATIADQPAEITEFNGFSCIGKRGGPSGGNDSYLTGSVTGGVFNGVDTSCSTRIRHEGTSRKYSVVALDQSGGDTDQIDFRVNSTGFLSLNWIENGGTTVLTATTNALVADTWYTVGWKLNRSAGTLTIYINGVNVETTAAGTIRSAGTFDTLAIGDFGQTGGSTSGAFIAGVAIAPVGWSDAEFLEVHNKFLANNVPT